ncbi:MAG: GTPase (G3E family) [Lachnospiraceae bacterium]|nr:GTPase (G3E family) [Lachnospiraceae bacterium]
MIKIDLVTGFLGAGKTTFLKKYAEDLVAQGYHVGIIENDFGAVNIDMLMLQDLLGDRIDVEQIVGGSVVTDWKRRFRTKLISMAMRGFNRILVEPSGIYDVDTFFDVLGEEPIDTWYEVGNIITILDANMDEGMSRQEEYLMVSQSANAGMLLLSKVQEATEEDMTRTIDHLNRIMEEFKCPRRFSHNAESILRKPWDDLTEEDFKGISECGYVHFDHEKLWFDPKKSFSSLFFMHVKLSEEALRSAIQSLFSAPDLGTIFRIKGYLPLPDGNWLQINATPAQTILQRVPMGQEIIIVIGQDLQEIQIRPFLFP